MPNLLACCALPCLLITPRSENPPPLPEINAEGEALLMTLPTSDEPTLLSTDMEQEQAYMTAAGFTFSVA